MLNGCEPRATNRHPAGERSHIGSQRFDVAVGTVEPTLTCLDLLGIYESGKATPTLNAEVPKLAQLWLGGLERRRDGREWIACTEFSVADIMMTLAMHAERLGVRVDDIR